MKEFDTIVSPNKDLLIRYFQNCLKLCICAQLQKRDNDLENWQVVMERAIDVKANAGWELFCLIQENDARYPQGHCSIKSKDFRNQKDSKSKKTLVANQKSGNNGGWSGQCSQVLGKPAKKNLRLCCGAHWDHVSNTLVIGINNIMIKKGKKVELDSNQIKYYKCYKKDHYANKYSHKELNN